MIIPLDKSQGEFEKRDSSYVKLLEGNKIFEKLIIKARETCNIEKPLSSYATGALASKAGVEAENIVNFYDLPTSWIIPISNFIVLGKLPSPAKGIFMSGLAFYINPHGKKATDFYIKITQKTSFDTLRRWIFKNKTLIEKHLEQLPKKNPNFRSNIKQRIEIFKLSNEGYKPKKIHQTLRKKYPPEEQHDVPTEPEISRIIYELKKELHR